MNCPLTLNDAAQVALAIEAEIGEPRVGNALGERVVLGRHTQRLKEASPEFVLDGARGLAIR